MALETMEARTGIRPTAFPHEAEDGPFIFKKSKTITGHMSKEVYRELWERGCIEVEGLPPMDLKNPIHRIFRREAFPAMSDQEYKFLTPAVTLASRFITDDAFMEFWTHICTGKAEYDMRPGRKFKEMWRLQVIEEDATIPYDEARERTREALSEVADNLTFLMLDEKWSKFDQGRAAECFVNPEHWQCRRHEIITEKGCKSGTCPRCDEAREARCFICGTTWYGREEEEDLRDLAQIRHLPYKGLVKDQLIAVLEAHDGISKGEGSALATSFRMTDEQLSNMQVGLQWNVIKHIREAVKGETWTQSQEIRFQLAVAATLCHELAHIFWWWTHRQCWNCEQAEPWWSTTEAKFDTGPEIGESFEYFAFGSKIPWAVKLHESADQGCTTIYDQCQWNVVHSTARGGEDRHDALRHDFILPVVYIFSWFQEKTWEAIAQHGRIAGRPSHDSCVIMRMCPTDMIRTGEGENLWDAFRNHECTIERYSHQDLVAQGGFNGGNDDFLYGDTGLTTKSETNTYINGLQEALIAKLAKEENQKRRKKSKAAPAKVSGPRGVVKQKAPEKKPVALKLNRK